VLNTIKEVLAQCSFVLKVESANHFNKFIFYL